MEKAGDRRLLPYGHLRFLAGEIGRRRKPKTLNLLHPRKAQMEAL